MVLGFPLLSPPGSSREFLVFHTPACKFLQQILVLSEAVSRLRQQAWKSAYEVPKPLIRFVAQPDVMVPEQFFVLCQGCQIAQGIREKLIVGSGADRIVGAIRSGVRRGDADYAAMT